MAKAASVIMTILKTVYLARLRQGNIEFSRFKKLFSVPLQNRWAGPATHHKYQWQKKLYDKTAEKFLCIAQH